ncbi:N-acetylated-alpha-linked acidic dipeptidase 2-like isoform X2 [Dermacentor albipictus]|uniref:N-acetylated-alpha-linked acidic dipeptidase 2-like isoform X2 n=1 Tax=Dermacentor albipictus TaxID=60249 RepID=UPI0031FDECAE
MAASTDGDENSASYQGSNENDERRCSGHSDSDKASDKERGLWRWVKRRKWWLRPRLSRSPSERVLLNWVLCLITFVGVVTVSMLFVLMKVYQNSRFGPKDRQLAELYSLITTDGYKSDDGLNDALLEQITDHDMALMLRAFEKAKAAVDPITTVKNYWESLDMDVLKVKKYRILRSYPHDTKMNEVGLYRHRTMLFNTTSTDVQSSISNNRSAFLAYSPAGDVTGPAVYVNYAEDSDFNLLSSYNINVAGRICLIRVGKIAKGEQIMNVQARGAIGAVFFLSSLDVSAAVNRSDSFPEPIWIGDNALQHGTVARLLGDPLTPGYPSHGGLHRLSVQESGLPSIPAQPINEDDARDIFRYMTEVTCPEQWDPHLNVQCALVLDPSTTLRIKTHNIMNVSTFENVIGMWRGNIEPDRLVVLGARASRIMTSPNLENQWFPVSQLLQQTIAFRTLRRRGWRPRRSLAFVLWHSDEHGAQGSAEWVEDRAGLLRKGGVIYVDNSPVVGSLFEPHASPGLFSSLREVTSRVHPDGGEETLKSTWKSQPHTPKNADGEPMALPVTGHSDDGPFAFAAGMPTLAVSFGEPARPYGVWPAHRMVSTNSSELTNALKTATQVGALMARMWADREVLPYAPAEMAWWLTDALERFERRHADTLRNHGLSIKSAKRLAKTFHKVAESFMHYVAEAPRTNPLITCMINDIMAGMEKVFTIPRGVPTRHITHRNILYSPEGIPFPGLEDVLRLKPVNKVAFRKHLALLMESITQATELMTVTPF